MRGAIGFEMIEITKPIMSTKSKKYPDGKRRVGLAEYKLLNERPVASVKIHYRRKRGDAKGAEIYPIVYHIEVSRAFTYPRQLVKGTGIWLRIIPIEDMTEAKG